MLRPLAPLRALANARALHSTAVRTEQSSREITSDFLARLMKQSPSTTPASSGSQDAARSMISNLGHPETSDNRRQTFSPKMVLSPDAFSADALYPPMSRTFAKAPLLGPGVKTARRIDPFHIRGQNPVDHASNPLMSFEFTDVSGRIKKRAETGLTWKSQRRMGKMVRRARAMGVISRWGNRARPGGLGHTEFWRK